MKRFPTWIAIGIAVLGAQMATEHVASAAKQCNGAGWLCAYDSATGQYANFSGNNPNWYNYGWSDRADEVKNDGNTHNVCLYDWTYYDDDGDLYFLPRNGLWVNITDNWVSSNFWTTASNVTGCYDHG